MQSNDPTLVEPAIFWFWNDTPTRAQIDEQLDAFAAAGFGGVYVHPMPQAFRPAEFRGGIEVEYLSPAFFDLIAYACAAMRERRLTMWLYDEGGWPSGMAGGRVIREDASYGIWVLEKRGASIKPMQLTAEIAYPDLMNPAATDCFIRHTHDKYFQSIGPEFGKTVRGIFTDEARLIGRVGTDRIPYSPFIPAAFQADHGYPLDDVVPLLFRSDPDDPTRAVAHRDYCRTVGRLIARNFYGRIHDWCERHDLLFEGHHSGEDDFSRHGQYFGDYLEQARHYHIPGIDTIWRQIHPGQPGGNFAQLASSSARVRGGRIAVSESFAVYGAGLTLEQMKWIAAFQIVRGVNKIGAMASLLSTRGPRRISTCSDISPKNPVWRDVDQLNELVRRAARFSCEGKPHVRVGVYYRSELVAVTEADAFNRTHEAICDRLHDQLVGWAFVGLEDLSKATPNSDGIQVGALALSALVVHIDAPMHVAEINALSMAARAGVRILWVTDSANNAALPDVAGTEPVTDLRQIDLRAYGAVWVQPDLSGVRLLALSEGDWHGFLFFNQNPAAVEFDFTPRTGESARHLVARELEPNPPFRIEPDRLTAHGVRVHLHPGEMRAFEVSVPGSAAPPPVELQERFALNEGWEVRREQAFVIEDDIEVLEGSPDVVARGLGDFTQHEPDFSGSLVYRTTVDLDGLAPEAIAVLDLGTAYFAVEVWVNGKPVGRRAWSPFHFDVTRHLRAGANELRVRVTNTLANQWLRPEVHDRDKRDWSNMYLERVTPFLADSAHAGLVGPVVLRVYGPRKPAT